MQSILYILHDYSSLTFVESRRVGLGGSCGSCGERTRDIVIGHQKIQSIYTTLRVLLSQLYSVTQPLIVD